MNANCHAGVPVPSHTVWLFGSDLLGLIAIARRRKRIARYNHININSGGLQGRRFYCGYS
jgi:hypothetical protein